MIETGEFQPCATCYTPTNMFSLEQWAYFCDAQCCNESDVKGIFNNEYGKSYV